MFTARKKIQYEGPFLLSSSRQLIEQGQGRMRERFFVALAVTGGAYAIAFINPSLVSSAKRDPSSSRRQPGLKSNDAHTLTLDVASYMIPHPDKASTGGEDACFVLEHEFGVFDGVGGWTAIGHDPGIFTRGFAEAVAANITAQRLEEDGMLGQSQDGAPTQQRFSKGVNLKQALVYATAHAPGEGTCTVNVVTFDPAYGILNGVNVGDSGALLIRRDTRGTLFVALRSATQRHKFNQPYQLGTGSKDKAEDAQPFMFYVREGDVVVLATDGLLDNMYEADIIRCISEASEQNPKPTDPELSRESNLSASRLADVLARRAYDLSLNKKRRTPWEDEAVAAGIVPERDSVNKSWAAVRRPDWSWDITQWGVALGRAVRSKVKNIGRGDKKAEGIDNPVMSEEDMMDFRGGKLDDITVVVATVRRAGIPKAAENADQGRKNRLAATAGVGTCASVDTQSR